MKKYAVITGASSGIGKEFAIQLSHDYHLILVARRKERLEAIAKQLKTPCEIIIADLSKEEECYQLFDKIKTYPIDLFINNAGFGDCDSFFHSDLDKETQMIHVNITALHILTKLVLNHMQKRNSGYLLNVASSAGLTPGGPYMATYYATKSYVTSLTRAIAQELKEQHSDIYIGCLCPGPVDTEFNDIAQVEFALKGISASSCVQYCLKKMFQRQIVIIPTLKMKIALTLGKWIPSSLYIKIISHQQKKKIQRRSSS